MFNEEETNLYFDSTYFFNYFYIRKLKYSVKRKKKLIKVSIHNIYYRIRKFLVQSFFSKCVRKNIHLHIYQNTNERPRFIHCTQTEIYCY